MGRAALELVRDVSRASAPAAGQVARSSAQRQRIIDGALQSLARYGVAKTTLDDIARAAGCSRATVYRVFPGGKDALLAAVVDTELARLFSELAVRMGEAVDLEAVLVAGMSSAAERITGHRALAFVLEHEPELLVPQLAFDRCGEVLASVAGFAAPFLGRWLAHDEAVRVAEWAARIVLSYLSCPAPGVDLTDVACTRHIVRTYVLPGISAAAEEQAIGAAVRATPARRRLVPVNEPASSKGETP